ncbi:hypothetical protein, partial [Nocardioides daphniae]|uniref:hypothetical protein n=1 Tax=Nocardioides daphniae TaxID=402297 RepID=UPI003530FD50
MSCEKPVTPEEARQYIEEHGSGPQATHVYRTVAQCTPTSSDSGGGCTVLQCPNGEPGSLYSLEESPIQADPRIWTHIAFVCLESADELQTISAADVAREFKRLTWPAARMTIQPPDGETLVNLPTIFFTNDTSTQTQTVTLLGQ